MSIDTMYVELTIVLGKTRMPVGRVLRLGRGAIVTLDQAEEDIVEVLANGLPIARGRVGVDSGSITVELTELVRRTDVTRVHGSTIGGHFRLDPGIVPAATDELVPAM